MRWNRKNIWSSVTFFSPNHQQEDEALKHEKTRSSFQDDSSERSSSQSDSLRDEKNTNYFWGETKTRASCRTGVLGPSWNLLTCFWLWFLPKTSVSVNLVHRISEVQDQELLINWSSSGAYNTKLEWHQQWPRWTSCWRGQRSFPNIWSPSLWRENSGSEEDHRTTTISSETSGLHFGVS